MVELVDEKSYCESLKQGVDRVILVHKHMDNNTNHFTPLALGMQEREPAFGS